MLVYKLFKKKRWHKFPGLCKKDFVITTMNKVMNKIILDTK